MCKKRTWKRERLPRVSPLIVLTMVVVSLISPWLMFSVHQTPLFILVSADSWPPSCDGVSNKQPRHGQTTETHFLSELALLDHTNNNTLYTSYTIRTLNKHASVWHLIARGLTFSKDSKCPLAAFFEHKKRPPGQVIWTKMERIHYYIKVFIHVKHSFSCLYDLGMEVKTAR